MNQKLALKPNLSSRKNIRSFAQKYTFKKIKPSGASSARQLIMQQLRTRPVAVDVKDYHQLYRQPGGSGITYRYHCVVISGYDAQKDRFIIRNSNSHASSLRGSETVPASGLCTRAYNIYYLDK